MRVADNSAWRDALSLLQMSTSGFTSEPMVFISPFSSLFSYLFLKASLALQQNPFIIFFFCIFFLG